MPISCRTWRCADNPDPAYNRCAAPQELTNDQIDVLLGLAAKPPKPPKLAKPKHAPLTPQAEAALRESEAAAAAAAAAAGAHGKSLGAVVEQLVKQAKLPPLQARAVQWHVANLEYGCATPLSQVSLAWWDQDDSAGMEGDHAVVVGGYGKLVAALAAQTSVLLQREVVRVEHGHDGVRVHTRGGGEGLEADVVLVTVPLGVLKAGALKFAPPLPPWKKEATSRLGFGPMEKVVLLFSRRFWVEDDFFGILVPPGTPASSLDAARGEFFLFWNLERSHGLPALACISSGAFAATAWKRMNYKAVVKAALASLERAYGEQATSLFRRSVVSDWGRNPYARGSYSFVAVGSSGRDYDELARPVGTRLFFAGEHTNGQHPATATGAFLSGLREAQRIDHAARHGFASLPAGQQAPPSQPQEAEARPVA